MESAFGWLRVQAIQAEPGLFALAGSVGLKELQMMTPRAAEPMCRAGSVGSKELSPQEMTPQAAEMMYRAGFAAPLMEQQAAQRAARQVKQRKTPGSVQADCPELAAWQAMALEVAVLRVMLLMVAAAGFGAVVLEVAGSEVVAPEASALTARPGLFEPVSRKPGRFL